MIEDTICAPATPPIPSPIGIVRISGPGARRAVDSIFRPAERLEPRKACFGTIVDKGMPVDDVIAVWYRAPKSYTGEEMAEIFCHGNPIIVQKIVRLLLEQGVRMATPGEFTRRAFVNGKTDLTGAEAVRHIITARSEWEIEASLRQMHGALREVIGDLRARITSLKADVEARIDFPEEEDVEDLPSESVYRAMAEIRDSIAECLSRCRAGERLSHGLDVTIVGKPNVGKSSILNLLLNQERAIVSSIPGTTRDVIRETIQIGGMPVNLEDTAGMGSPSDEIEKIGIDMSARRIESSSCLILVLDATTGITDEDVSIIEKTKGKNRIIVINKIDAGAHETVARMREEFMEDVVILSARTGYGLADLRRAIAQSLQCECVEKEHTFIADTRVISILERSMRESDRILDLISNRAPEEVVAFELQVIMDLLAEVTGEISPDHVLDSIFSRFCIGK